MGHNTQKYRYGNFIVEVQRLNEISTDKSRFECLVRGYGHGNPAPRETYIIIASTNAQASRNAFELYKQDNANGTH